MDTRSHVTDDPRLTAYALGELKGQEREAIEQLLRASAESRAEVEAIRRVAGALTYELAGDLPQSPFERAACSQHVCNGRALEPAGILRFARAAAAARDRSPLRRRLGLAAAGATAAGIAIVLMVLSSSGVRRRSAATRSAQGERNSFAVPSDAAPPSVTSIPQNAHHATPNAAPDAFARAVAPTGGAALPPGTNVGLGGAIADAHHQAPKSTQPVPVSADTGTPYDSDPFQSSVTIGGLMPRAPRSAESPTSAPARYPLAGSPHGNQSPRSNAPAPPAPNVGSFAAAAQRPGSTVTPVGDAYPYYPTATQGAAVGMQTPTGVAISGVAPASVAPQQGGLPTAANPRTPSSEVAGYSGATGARGSRLEWDDGWWFQDFSDDRRHGIRGRAHDTRVGAESYAHIVENAFLFPLKDPLSTFSVDVDTASYANVRRFLDQQQLPPLDAVRIEEMLNYFSYDYAPPADGKPFAVHVETAACPWNTKHRLARIAIKGREVPRDKRPPSNLVFLVDVSGSMDAPNRLPLVKAGLTMLAESLTENDRVAIVTYAGSVQKVLDSTTGDKRSKIMGAINQLTPGGATNGEGGIQMAYETAVKGFRQGGTNRIILCTDGDFNVGVSDDGELVKLIEEKRKSGVFLSIFGFGMGNLKDAKLERLADHGNGQYGYIDSRQEARKVFVEGLSGTLVTIAKDVKLQVEFNPAQVGAYRLIGYENRALAAEDFNNDAKDAGDIGAGHSVTALYEIVPASELTVSVDPLKYQGHPAKAAADKAASDELFTLKLRYKQPDDETSQKLEVPCKDRPGASAHPSRDFDWAAGVAAFGLLLRDSKYKGSATFDLALELAQGGKGADKHGYRGECIELMRKAQGLKIAQQPHEPVPGPLGGPPGPPPGPPPGLIEPFGQGVPTQAAPSAPHAPGSTQSGSRP